MNPVTRWLTEKRLKSRGWEMGGYPSARGHPGYMYMVYWHPDIPHSTGTIEWAVERENGRLTIVGDNMGIIPTTTKETKRKLRRALFWARIWKLTEVTAGITLALVILTLFALYVAIAR